MKQRSKADQVLALATKNGLLRARDLGAAGIPTVYLRRLCQRGLLVQVSRGLYRPVQAKATEYQMMVECAKLVPRGTMCLLSALAFHDLTTQLPPELWVAIGSKDWRPKVVHLPVRFLRFSGAALTEGVQTHAISNVPVQVYCPAKTVADCFKYRNKVGLEVAIQALRDCWRSRKATADELWRYAKICRVANVMRPYMESLV